MRELGGAAAAAVALLASPYLAGLTLAVPDRSIASWWKPRKTSRGRYTVTATAGLTLAALAGTATGLGSSWPAYVVLAVLGAVLVVVDVEQHRLPNRLLAPLAIAGAVLLALAAGLDNEWDRLSRAALGVLAVGVILYLLALAAPRSVGLGDVKLAALLAGYLAWRGTTAAAPETTSSPRSCATSSCGPGRNASSSPASSMTPTPAPRSHSASPTPARYPWTTWALWR